MIQTQDITLLALLTYVARRMVIAVPVNKQVLEEDEYPLRPTTPQGFGWRGLDPREED